MMCNVKAKIVTFTVLPLYPSDSRREQGNYRSFNVVIP